MHSIFFNNYYLNCSLSGFETEPGFSSGSDTTNLPAPAWGEEPGNQFTDGFTYEGVAGQEGRVLQHVQAGGAVARGAVELAAAAVADVAGGVGNLPAVDENSRILAHTHCGAVGQSQVVWRVSITETWGGCEWGGSQKTQTLLQT